MNKIENPCKTCKNSIKYKFIDSEGIKTEVFYKCKYPNMIQLITDKIVECSEYKKI